MKALKFYVRNIQVLSGSSRHIGHCCCAFFPDTGRFIFVVCVPSISAGRSFAVFYIIGSLVHSQGIYFSVSTKFFSSGDNTDFIIFTVPCLNNTFFFAFKSKYRSFLDICSNHIVICLAGFWVIYIIFFGPINYFHPAGLLHADTKFRAAIQSNTQPASG